MRRLVLPLLLASVLHAQDAELAAAVDLASPKARRKAALDLAKRGEVDLEGWLAAMRALAPRGTMTPGTHDVTAALRVGDRTEQTGITVHSPERYDRKRAAPLIVSLHGAGGHGPQEAYRWREVADELGMLVIAPTEAGENAGYGFSARERAAALAAIRWARRELNVDENRIHLTGVSRGGHMTWDVGTRHPDLFATLSPMIGGPRLDTRSGQNNLRYVENVAHLPIRDLQGEGDDKRMLFNLRLAFRKLKAAGARDAQLLTFPELGHSFRFEAVEWREFFGRNRRDPRPPRVVRLTATPGEGRAYWVEILKTKREVKEAFMPKVDVSAWNAMDDGARRRHIAEAADRRTARLEAEIVEPGVFRIKSTGVTSFRVLLTAEMFDPGEPVKVIWNGRARTRKLKPARRVVLTDFVERFDRTFLPVAEFRIP